MSVNAQQQNLLWDSPEVSLILANSTIHAADSMRSLGVLPESHLVGAIVKPCKFHLCQISRVRRYINADTCRLAGLALVISRLDYCNSGSGMLITRPREPRGRFVHITTSNHPATPPTASSPAVALQSMCTCIRLSSWNRRDHRTS